MNSTQYADVETSSAGYATRFSGVAGRWLLSVQARIFLKQLSPLWMASEQPLSLLDVGGGHGQIVEAIVEGNVHQRCAVTVLGSEPICSERIQNHIAARHCTFAVGDPLKLPYPDKSFDVVTSFRFIPHCDAWNQHIKELCRVARRAVIVDYPTQASVNCLSTLLFQFKKRIEKNTRTFTVFRNAQISHAFADAGYRVVKRTGEFFWPMVIHRVLKNAYISTLLELPFAVLGITNILGSPVIVRADRLEEIQET